MDYSRLLDALKDLIMHIPTVRFWALWLLGITIFGIPAVIRALAPNGLIH